MLKVGKIVPFLGAGASAIYRPDGEAEWTGRSDFLPFGSELARTLAKEANYPEANDSVSDLALVASYYEHVEGDREALNIALQDLLSGDHRPGSIHQLLAKIDQPLLIVTTNYDDLIEQAFDERAFHLVVDRGDRDSVSFAGKNGFESISAPRLREALQPEDRPIVYKLHGSLDQDQAEDDSFLITEQDYVDFLGRADTCVPSYLAGLMANSRFLFLGYSLADWNVRVMLSKLRQPSKEDGDQRRSWAINKSPKQAEKDIWEAHKVNVYDMDLRDFATRLAQELGRD